MILFRQLLIIIALSVILGFGVQISQKTPLPLWGFPKSIQLIQPAMAVTGADIVSPDSAFIASDKIYAVDLSAAVGLYMKRKRSSVHFIDARETEIYDEGHLPGAINIPFEELPQFTDSLECLPRQDLVVLYCDGGDCVLSHDLAEWMLEHGWRRLAVYEGGWDEWSRETDFIEKTRQEH